MSREYKHYELRNSPRPLFGGRYAYVCSCVAITGADNKPYYCYVAFSDSFVRAVGKKLPRGVSAITPALLYVTLSDGSYSVLAKYCVCRSPGDTQLLWSGSLKDGLPTWLKLHKLKGAENATA